LRAAESGRRRPSSKKILQKALWESQSWLVETFSDSGVRQMTQLFGVEDLLTISRTRATGMKNDDGHHRTAHVTDDLPADIYDKPTVNDFELI
jgi:hypothetical protein